VLRRNAVTMNIYTIASDSRLRTAIIEARALIRQPDHAISDVVDKAGHQYVDLVMEGGGMLGIALVGYTWALEEMGIRFLNIGGTSAGSINALLLSAMNDPSEKKSPQLLDAMGSLDFYRFVDGDGTEKGRRRARALIDLLMDGRRVGVWKKVKLAKRYWSIRRQLIDKYGINSGIEFTNWLTELLSSVGINNSQELAERMRRIPALRIREGIASPESWKPQPGRLALIASDITTETRVEFPEMADLYWKSPLDVHPANFARASMSIPFFFETFRVKGLPNGSGAASKWREVGVDLDRENHGEPPPFALFVDGGVTSNFPVDIFHDRKHIPTRPTFGVKLQYDHRYKPPERLPLTGNGSRRPLQHLGSAIFNTARHTLDYEFLTRHPDFRHLVQFIPCAYQDPKTDATVEHNWLNFNMPESERTELFKEGADKAIEFVRSFASPVDAKGSSPDRKTAAFGSKWAFYKERVRS
jgi:NTE family protein